MPMKKHKPEQIVAMLRQIEVEIANGKSTPHACKEAEITVQTYCVLRRSSAVCAVAALEHRRQRRKSRRSAAHRATDSRPVAGGTDQTLAGVDWPKEPR
jgi:hypothetical protein